MPACQLPSRRWAERPIRRALCFFFFFFFSPTRRRSGAIRLAAVAPDRLTSADVGPPARRRPSAAGDQRADARPLPALRRRLSRWHPGPRRQPEHRRAARHIPGRRLSGFSISAADRGATWSPSACAAMRRSAWTAARSSSGWRRGVRLRSLAAGPAGAGPAGRRFDGIFANAVLFHVPSQALPVSWAISRDAQPGGVLFSSNPRGRQRRGLEPRALRQPLARRRRLGGRYVIECSRASSEIEHYYRPAGVPREQQQWLATVWRKRRPTGCGATVA